MGSLIYFAFAYAKVSAILHFRRFVILTNSENDTLARIGTSCLQQLLEGNIAKLTPDLWERVTTAFIKLFRTTTPHQLFDESLRVEIDGGSSEATDTNGKPSMCMST